MVSFLAFSVIISLLIMVLFFYLSKKSDWDSLSASGFECGFSSYFSSRFSFSVHYFLVALIFLFFDLELSLLFLFFLEESTPMIFFLMVLLVSLLLGGLFLEWLESNLDWVY